MNLSGYEKAEIIQDILSDMQLGFIMVDENMVKESIRNKKSQSE
jgi:hypothetical protein